MKRITLNLGEESYDIHIGFGLLKEAGHLLLTHDLSQKAFIITDNTVDALYGDTLEKSLANWGINSTRLIVPAGEEHKSLDNAGKLFNQLAESFADRKSPVLALGGGVIGDLAGFVAATYMRGIPLIQVPTTLVAQADSSIGGKTAVDHGNLKNMIGVFYQPRLTISDISLLQSLGEGKFKDGLAEIIKHAIILDKVFFEYLEENIERVIGHDDKVLEYVLSRSVEIKAGIVEKDERDEGVRNILNFGHTVGHALESISDFKISHGEAVAIGMVAAAKVSQRRDMLSGTELSRIIRLLERAGLPTRLPDLNIDDIVRVIHHDKKAIEGNIRFVTIVKIGDPVISDDIGIKAIDDALHKWDDRT